MSPYTIVVFLAVCLHALGVILLGGTEPWSLGFWLVNGAIGMIAIIPAWMFAIWKPFWERLAAYSLGWMLALIVVTSFAAIVAFFSYGLPQYAIQIGLAFAIDMFFASGAWVYPSLMFVIGAITNQVYRESIPPLLTKVDANDT